VGGNPFFVEELVRNLAESGALERKGGAFRAAAPIDETAVPATVQSVLAARIDRLSERDKTVLQTAAVIGHQFTEPLLKRVTRLDDGELRAALRALVGADLLVKSARPRPGTRSSTTSSRRSPTALSSPSGAHASTRRWRAHSSSSIPKGSMSTPA
jgi:predicted ATPase